MATIESRVRKVVQDQLNHVKPAEITNTAHFEDDLGADSLDMKEIIMGLEKEFGIDIPEEEAKKITSFQAAFNYIDINQQE